jgi:rare lipoprotein A
MKKIRILTSAILLGSILSSTSVFAADTTVVPGHMAPGTVIKFNQDKQMEVVKQGKENRISNADKNAVPEDLPAIKANMTVTYDALGAPIVIVPESELDNSKISVEMKEVKSTDLKDTDQSSISRGSQSGKISWFDIWGEDDTASGSKSASGAAHKTIKLRTWVDVDDEDTGNSTSVQILDRGPYVSGRILDMSEESFNEVDNTDNGVFSGSISW